MKTVLQKFIADSGYCSRRKAEESIKNGKVSVNNEKAVLGMRVGKDDEIFIDGKKLNLAKSRIYIILNKPKGYVCTNRKFSNEKNIFELIETGERLFVAGRLDKDSRGLVLLTNDGMLAERLTHPRYEHEKEYEIEIRSQKFEVSRTVKKLLDGVDIGAGDGVVRVKRVRYLGENKFRIVLTEGKKRQIRRMFKVLGLRVSDLKRTRIGKMQLGDLKEGDWLQVDKDRIL